MLKVISTNLSSLLELNDKMFHVLQQTLFLNIIGLSFLVFTEVCNNVVYVTSLCKHLMLGCGIVTAYAVKIFIAIYIWKFYI